MRRGELALTKRVLCMKVFLFYFVTCLRLFQTSCCRQGKALALLFTLVIFFPILSSVVIRRGLSDVCIIPFTVVPVVIHIFLSSEATFVTRIAVVLLYSVALHFPRRFVLLRMITKVITVCDLERLSRQSRLLQATLIMFVDCTLLCFTFRLVRRSSLAGLGAHVCVCFVVGNVLLLFTCPLLFLLRGVFNFASSIALIRLSGVGGDLLQRVSRMTPNAFRRSLRVTGLTTTTTGGVKNGDRLIHAKTLCRSVNGVIGPTFFARGRSKIGPRGDLDCRRDTRIVVDRVASKLGLTRGRGLPGIVGSFVDARRKQKLAGCFCVSCGGRRPSRRISRRGFHCPNPGPFAGRRTILVVTSSMRTTSHDLPRCARRDVDALMSGVVSARMSRKCFGRYPVAFGSVTAIGTLFGRGLGAVCRAQVDCPRLEGWTVLRGRLPMCRTHSQALTRHRDGNQRRDLPL